MYDINFFKEYKNISFDENFYKSNIIKSRNKKENKKILLKLFKKDKTLMKLFLFKIPSGNNYCNV